MQKSTVFIIEHCRPLSVLSYDPQKVVCYLEELRHTFLLYSSGRGISSNGAVPEEYSVLPSTCAAYSLSQLQQATDGWSDANLLGRGGFGEVYRGVDPQNPSFVMAVKRATVQTTKFREEVCFELLYMDGVNLCSL